MPAMSNLMLWLSSILACFVLSALAEPGYTNNWAVLVCTSR